MDSEALRKAVQLSLRAHVFVATADADGMPHVAAAGALSQGGDQGVSITEWFCPGTVENVRDNPAVAVVVWDGESDSGYQLLGEVEGVDDMAVLDGYSAQTETGAPQPQVSRRLRVRVSSVLDFSRAPHSDVEE
jgi:hypothetical protein